MIGWWWWFNVKFYYLSYILRWKEGARIESSNISWYWRIVSSSWRFIPPFTFGSCSYLWKSLLPLNKNYWLFLIYCVWCIVVYWCNSYTIVHCSLDIIEWLKYKIKKVFKLYLILIHPPFSINNWYQSGLPSVQFNHWKEDPKKKWKTKFQMGFHHLMEAILNTGVIEWKLTWNLLVTLTPSQHTHKS